MLYLMYFACFDWDNKWKGANTDFKMKDSFWKFKVCVGLLSLHLWNKNVSEAEKREQITADFSRHFLFLEFL